MIEFHSEPIVGICDVCKYATTHDLDCGYEHARANVATAWLIQDLSEVESLPLRALAVSAAGVEPGPVHDLEPRHWFWAMWFEPNVRISLREPSYG